MREALEPYLADLGPLEIVDVDANSLLEERFGERVPVLLANDVEVCHYVLDHDALAKRLGAMGP
jgi:hypothetical protein